MRPKFTEAKSLGFYIILSIDLIISATLATLVGTHIVNMSDAGALVGALIGVDGAMLGFMITIFALYFTYNMPDGVKELLKKHGFYTQIPRDMVRSIIILTISLVSAIVSYFLNNVAHDVIVAISIVQFIGGLALALYVTFRFFIVLKHQ